jgi:CRP-like cAMP-binding protein
MAATAKSEASGNRLLDRLPAEEYEMLLPSLERVALTQGEELYRQYGPLTHVYFPQKGCLSSVVHAEEGLTVECGAVGNEGMLGLQVYLGLEFSPIRSVAQIPGQALRLPAALLRRGAKPGSALERLVRRYIAFYLRYANQSVACNSLHPVEERMSKWLLMAQDRAGEDTFVLTQEYLAEMIGARRQTVSMIAGTLRGAGLIRYHRGTMQITNRQGLEAASCECYAIIKDFYARIMQ